MTFDEKMRERAKREQCPVPEDFDRRLDALLETLPERQEAAGKRRPVRLAVCIGVAAALMVGAGAAAPAVLSMTQGAVDFFSGGRGADHSAKRSEFEKYNAAAGVSQTVGNRTLTIDNIAVDDSYLNVFYTLKGEGAPLERFQGVGDEKYPESLIAEWSAPCFWAKVDGKELDTSGSVEEEAYFEDNYTLKGMQRIVLKKALPDEFELTLFTAGTSKEADAEFSFALAVDKSAVAVDSLTVEPQLDFPVDYSSKDEEGNPYRVQRNARIERVSISPFGSTITLSEVTPPEEAVFDSFVLRDETGRDLYILPSGSVGSSDILRNRVSNSFEFVGADTSTKAITVIPFSSSYRSHEVKGDISALPLTDGVENGMTLESLEIGAEKATAVFSLRGACWETFVGFNLLDENGERITGLSDEGFAEQRFDYETGRIVATLSYPNASEELVQRVKGVAFWQQDDITLLTDQAVSIPLR